MAYNRNDLKQGDINDDIFHTNTKKMGNNRKTSNNEQILNYRMFNGPFELNPLTNFHSTNFQSPNFQSINSQNIRYESPITEFNRTIDNLHLPQDMNRPMSTRDQVKNHETQQTRKKTNDYFNQHQFMPSRLGNKSMTGFDMYSVDSNGFDMTINSKQEKRDGYYDMF